MAWNILVVATGREGAAQRALEQDTYYPCFQRLSRRTGKPVGAIEAMWPGYIFIREPDLNDWHSILNAPDVRGVLCFAAGGEVFRPAPFLDSEMNEIRAMSHRDDGVIELRKQYIPRFRIGRLVKFTGGSFEGHMAEVLGEQDEGSFLVSVNLFGRDMPVVADAKHLTAA